MEKLQQERLIIAITAQTAAEDMLSLTVDYVKSRQAFGKQNSDFQIHNSSLAKYWITENARELSVQCMQLHGGYGYM